MDYELYHDESQEAGYWHGILLVPGHEEARDNTGYYHPFSLKKVRNPGMFPLWKRI
jgi:hypothetical protein